MLSPIPRKLLTPVMIATPSSDNTTGNHMMLNLPEFIWFRPGFVTNVSGNATVLLCGSICGAKWPPLFLLWPGVQSYIIAIPEYY